MRRVTSILSVVGILSGMSPAAQAAQAGDPPEACAMVLDVSEQSDRPTFDTCTTRASDPRQARTTFQAGPKDIPNGAPAGLWNEPRILGSTQPCSGM